MGLNKVKLKRMEMNLTQLELAKEVRVTRQTIGLIESNNYNPSLKLCINICRSLNATLDELFWEENYVD
ncbi:MAG TPA: helix-turn-helix transcriptional regulator [Clostridia bacterium]|nr:helix-turn-helix transcriptional regulator [Clostridia bacterium]